MKLLRSPTLALIFPVLAAFISSLVVFLLADTLGISDPLRVLIAPLVTFLPGGLLTTGTVELAAGQMIAGTARLVTGFVQLALLAFGILAAGTLVGVDGYTYMSSDSERLYLWWVPLIGLVLFAAGNYLHFSSPPTHLRLGAAGAGGRLRRTARSAASSSAPSLSGFFGAVLMTPLVLWIDSLRRGVPSQLTFLPAFWILVPGSAGLIGLTEVFGADANDQDLSSALTTVIAIALGVLIGTAVYRSIRYGAQELGNFHIDLPGVVAAAEARNAGLLEARVPTRAIELWP